MYRSVGANYIFSKLKALLILGSAVVLVSCDSAGKNAQSNQSNEYLVTESSRNLLVRMSENGRPSYIFEAPFVQGYTLASEPYRVFPEGVKITTFTNDSLSTTVNGVLTANYATYYEDRQLWEAIGDVHVVKSDGKELFSQQLFWNAVTKRIYSNVDTRIEDHATGDQYDGEGFESNEEMTEWSFRKLKGRMRVEESSIKSRPEEVSTIDSIVETAVEPIVDSVVELAVDSLVEPIIDSIVEPTVDSIVELDVDPAPDPAPAPAPDPDPETETKE